MLSLMPRFETPLKRGPRICTGTTARMPAQAASQISSVRSLSRNLPRVFDRPLLLVFFDRPRKKDGNDHNNQLYGVWCIETLAEPTLERIARTRALARTVRCHAVQHVQRNTRE